MQDKFKQGFKKSADWLVGPVPPGEKNVLKLGWRKARRILYHWRQRSRDRLLLIEARKEQPREIRNKSNRDPLVSVTIPTYNRAKILTERTIPSILRKTYQNFEVVIVGDCCTDDTEARIRALNDSRISFYNLPERGQYPSNPLDRWMVAGVVPANKSIELCSGDWIAPLDDDDEFSEDHIEVLLTYALEYDYEMVYGKVKTEKEPNEWTVLGSYPLKCGHISHLSVLCSSRLKLFKYDIGAWKYGEPADWNRWRRMQEAGVRIGFLDKVVGKHYLEGTQRRV